MNVMRDILNYQLNAEQAAGWFIGQSGFVFKSCDTVLVIDPYLSDSVAKVSPDLKRRIPPPIAPADLKADIFITTHDHLDHLDPETIAEYRYKDTTVFVAPYLAGEKLKRLGIKNENIKTIDVGCVGIVRGVRIEGIFTVPNESSVADTAGYFVKFSNGRNFYHSSDTDLSPALLEAAPKAEVGLFCINGKWGNMGIEKAAELAIKVNPKFAVPHHYDIMELNSENPASFKYQLNYYRPDIKVIIPKILEPFVW